MYFGHEGKFPNRNVTGNSARTGETRDTVPYRGVQAPGGSGEKPSVAPLNLKKYFEKKKSGS